MNTKFSCIKLFCLTILILFNRYSFSYSLFPENRPETLPDSSSTYQSDFGIFRDSLERIHPALYRYQDKKTMNHLFDSCYASISQDMTQLTFFMLIKFMTAAVEDGHLICNLPRDVIQENLSNAKVFPLRLWFIDKKAFVYCSNDKRFPTGTEIISIDHQPINEIKNVLFQYITSDGKIESKKYWSLNSSEASFQFLYYWNYGEKQHFNVEYLSPVGSKITDVVDAEIIKTNSCFFDKKPVENYLSLDLKDNNTALLTIKTFDMNKLQQDDPYFHSFLDSSFKEINSKKIKNLIIDVRGNGGGEDSNGSLLYSYLTDKPFPYYLSLETISTVLPKSLHPNLEIQQPAVNNFKGKCYFLINGKSFSTTSEFCAIAKSNERGIFVGEETGGGYYGNTGSEQAKFSLPNSQINIIIPKRKYVLAVKKTFYADRGIIPDFTVIPDINAVLQNKDVQLEYVLDLTKK